MSLSDNWERIPISAAYLGLFDGPHATPPPADDGPIFLGIKNITESGQLDFSDIRHISEADFPTWTRRVMPQPGDIVFSYEATLNLYAIIPEGFRGCLGRRLALIRPNPQVVDYRYLFYYFFGHEWRSMIATNMISGSTVDRIPLIRFPEFEIELPPLPLQHRIASILSAYDDLIENNTQRIKALEAAAQALYREWFVEFRFPGWEQVEWVEIGEGRVPTGWEITQLQDVIELAYGKGLTNDNRVPGPYPVYGSSGTVGYHDEYLVEGPGIIVGRKGNVGSVFWTDENFYPIDTVFYVVTDLNLHYVYYNLRHQNFINTDSAVPGLSRNQAYLLPFVVPSKEIMETFSGIVGPLFAQLRNLRASNDVLRETRDLLLPRLISGQVSAEGLPLPEKENKQDVS